MKQTFRNLSFPNNLKSYVPTEVELEFPTNSSLPKDDQHFLISIPWKDKYASFIPKKYQWFFKLILPYLRARTTDVHIAFCCQYIDQLISTLSADEDTKVNAKVVTLAFLLHDIGWSQLTESEIAASLGVSGLALNKTALGPKEKHAIEGTRIASKILQEHKAKLDLSESEIDLILKAIRYHDQPEQVASQGNQIPIEVKALVDLDHQWSFAKEAFWQDVYRKGIMDPQTYLDNLEKDLNSYFVTEAGRNMARLHLADRAQEVADFNSQFLK